MPMWAGAMVGIYGGGIHAPAHFNIKPDIAYRGGVGPSLWDFGLTHCHRLRTQTAVGGA